MEVLIKKQVGKGFRGRNKPIWRTTIKTVWEEIYSTKVRREKKMGGLMKIRSNRGKGNSGERIKSK